VRRLAFVQTARLTADAKHAGVHTAVLLGESGDALTRHCRPYLLPEPWHTAAVPMLVQYEGRVILDIMEHDSSAARGERLEV
jgi:hypothetical protein